MRIVIHGLMLYLINFLGIIAGFILFKLGRGNQLAIQGSTVFGVTFLFYILFCLCLKKISTKKVFPSSWSLAWILIASLVWHPVIFFPLHYLTQGYLSSWDNILVITVFQIPVNAAALILTFIAVQTKTNPI